MRHYSTRYKYKAEINDAFIGGNWNSSKKHAMAKWCEDNIGDQNWAFYMWTWRFRYKKDYTFFLLRWL